MNNSVDRIRLFALNNLAIEAAVQRVEREHDLDLGHRPVVQGGLDETYYPQFEEKIRREAADTDALRFYEFLPDAKAFLAAKLLQSCQSSQRSETALPSMDGLSKGAPFCRPRRSPCGISDHASVKT